MSRLRFISYDGKYPNLCSGKLIMELDGQEITFPSYCMISGGSVWFDKDWEDHIETGDWTINKFPEGFPEELKDEAIKLVNENVVKGCCGGCV